MFALEEESIWRVKLFGASLPFTFPANRASVTLPDCMQPEIALENAIKVRNIYGRDNSVTSIYGLDIRELDLGSIYYASSYTTTGSIFRASYGGGEAGEFRGSGFKYNSYG